jgi:nucleotide-binding universal stress UspA family protein
MIRIQKILVPTDNSPTALKAVQYAAEIAKFQRATIHLLYVLDDRYMSYMSLTDDDKTSMPNLQSKMESAMEKELNDLIQKQDLPAERFVFQIKTGKPCEEICGYANEVDADLIIMGTHGATGIKRILIGSVAERVVRRGQRPVLVVRPDERESFIE